MHYKSALFISLFYLPGLFGQVNVLTFHNDNARTGQNLSEPFLSPATLNSSQFGKLMNIVLDGKVDAQPLYVSALNMPGYGITNVVFAATEHDSVYAFDANTGVVYWHESMLAAGETTSDIRNCGQVIPEIGITATPVIDLTAGPHGTIYVVAMTKDSSSNYHHRLHALDLTTGAEQFSGPITIQATYPGTGANSSNGKVVFDPGQYKDRAGLLLLNGIVYTSWGSHCDINPYSGWIMGYDRLTLNQTSVFNFAPNGNEAAIWNSGAGPAADSAGNIYASVANGTFDGTLTSAGFPNQGDYGNAFVKLNSQNSTLTVADYWTMYNTEGESAQDTDLGSGGMMLLPDLTDSNGTVHHLGVGAGKDQNLYVFNRDNMGKFDSSTDGTIYQQLSGALPGGVWGSPAYFRNHVYFGPVGSAVYSFAISDAKLALSSTTAHTFTFPGITPSISAIHGTNGTLWAVENTNPAVLHAYDANNLAVEYYNSNQAPSNRDHFGVGNKFIAATIANGQVFAATTNSIGVFGHLPSLPVAGSSYHLANQMTLLALDDPLDLTNPGEQIVQWYIKSAAEQEWSFTPNGAGYYTIKNTGSGLYLSDPQGSKTPGTKLEQFASDGSDLQLWSLTQSGSGYVIKNKASGLVIDDPGASLAVGTVADLATPNGHSSQTWLIY